MATFFGEVLTAFSRAVGDDEDEEEVTENEEDQEIRRELEKQREVRVSWNSQISKSTESADTELFPCSNFLLAVGANAAGFLSSYVLNSENWKVVGSAALWNERCSRPTPRAGSLSNDDACVFYQMISNPTTFVCQCTCFVAEDQQFQWCEKVFGCMQKRNLKVTILSTCPVANYKTTESTFTLPVPFLKVLGTKRFMNEVSCCSLLEPPNIVDGLPAAVLSYCQVWQVTAGLFQCYTDAIKVDPTTIEAFKPLLSSPNLRSLSKIDTMLQKTVSCDFHNSALGLNSEREDGACSRTLRKVQE